MPPRIVKPANAKMCLVLHWLSHSKQAEACAEEELPPTDAGGSMRGKKVSQILFGNKGDLTNSGKGRRKSWFGRKGSTASPPRQLPDDRPSAPPLEGEAHSIHGEMARLGLDALGGLEDVPIVGRARRRPSKKQSGKK